MLFYWNKRKYSAPTGLVWDTKMDTMYASHHFAPHGRYELNKLTSLPMCGFIVQLIEHCAGIRRSRVRIALKPWFFQASSLQLLKLENLPRWSFFAFKMATLSLFWDAIMVAVTACGNAIQLFDWAAVSFIDTSRIWLPVFAICTCLRLAVKTFQKNIRTCYGF